MSLVHRMFVILLTANYYIPLKSMNLRNVDTSSSWHVRENVLKHSFLDLSKLQNVTNSDESLGTRWHVGRVSRKQFEIINMLWKKTKIFIDFDTSTKAIKIENNNSERNRIRLTRMPSTTIQELFPLTKTEPSFQTITPSFFEFYYFDETNENINQKDFYDTQSYKNLLKHYIHEFKENEATCKMTTDSFSEGISRNLSQFYNKTKNIIPLQTNDPTVISIHEKKQNSTSASTQLSLSQTSSNESKHAMKTEKNKIQNFKETLAVKLKLNKTTVADRIKFFELYDSDTYTPFTETINSILNSTDKYYNSTEEKMNLNHVNYEIKHDHNITRYVKKEVNNSLIKNIENTTEASDSTVGSTVVDNSKYSVHKNHNYSSKPVKWSDYPFIAVYAYEPQQVRCDAAAVSPHWLIVAAACLYRRHEVPQTDFQSAFVAYCSDNWRHSERITYVKRSLVHPRFHPQDVQRKHFYNIGAIQVENSLANTCTGWSAVSLISHQFVAPKDGISATAIGWGLDRYDINDGSTLPRYPLMAYESLMFSENCPGNQDYSKYKEHSNNEMDTKNVYCLLLPAYSTEENDAVHGAFLLIGGKLIALYLQEERFSWGVQSAQYTGIWHLLQWIQDIAREPQNQDLLYPFDV